MHTHDMYMHRHQEHLGSSTGHREHTLLTPQKDSKVSGPYSRKRVDTVVLGIQALMWGPDWKSQSKAKPSTPASQKQWVLTWMS